MDTPQPSPLVRKRGRRERKTRRSVLVAERVARTAISLGGGLTIATVSLICVFLAWVVFPLFGAATLSPARALAGGRASEPIVACAADEYASLMWVLERSGRVTVLRVDTGAALESLSVSEQAQPAALGFDAASNVVAVGTADGAVRLATLGFEVSYPDPASAGEALAKLRPGERTLFSGGLAERLPDGQVRCVRLQLSISEPFELGAGKQGSAPRLLDLNVTESGATVAALFEDGRLTVGALKRTTNMMTGAETLRFRGGDLPAPNAPHEELPIALRLLGAGDNVLLVWRDGHGVRYDARDLSSATAAESLELRQAPEVELTQVDAALGERTVLVGDSKGGVGAWFRTRPEQAGTVDGARMARGHWFEGDGVAVTALAPSATSRSFAVGRADGRFELYFLTSEKRLAEGRTPDGSAVDALCLAPREDALLVHSAGGWSAHQLTSHHPEASVSALLRPVWYENYEQPEHVWQSSSGADDFEAKFGLMPLVFGTLKATFYSLLFGVPLALLAAIFSSEYLAPRTRVAVKSTIEIMASLPSVVLGFLAGNVVAPLVQNSLAAVLASFYCVPIALLFGARLWQLAPQGLVLRLVSWQRLLVIVLALPAGLLAASFLGPWLEDLAFGGSLDAWLDRQHGGAAPGWFLLLLPVAAVGATLGVARLADAWVRRVSQHWSRARCAQFDFVRFCATGVCACLLAALAAALLDVAGFDPRGSLLDTYTQRNALVVGFIMGFAIIPIIYTLSEDALSSVPEQLRQASLGAGATPWQTALRVIVPTAASGLFSAVMVGLGRAVGETMIVLMAAGNTPIMDWNVFSGFRTLSANIAVELPEAVEGDTHYRTLFLAALALFAMTFVVNTGAELVRQRFRRRAYQL